MDPRKCKKKSEKERTKHITIRITNDISSWLKKNQYSPTAIFHEAIRDLGYKKKYGR